MPGATSKLPQPNDFAERSLQEQGFSAPEIESLRELRSNYPYIEYVDSHREWHHLRFVKWLYLKGEFKP